MDYVMVEFIAIEWRYSVAQRYGKGKRCYIRVSNECMFTHSSHRGCTLT
jgi:hypothetical protein